VKIFLVSLGAFLCGNFLALAADVDFKTQISPILEKSCVSCHCVEKHKGGLRLDSREAAFKGGDDGVVIVAGDASKSDFYRRVTLPASSDDVMPNKGSVLSKEQTDLIRDWINQGAKWPEGTLAAAPGTESAPTPSPHGKIAHASDFLATDFKPSAAETKAAASLQTMGIDLWPLAAGLHWHEANLRSQGDHSIDPALAKLKDVASLVSLNLANTKFTSAGLVNLKSLTNLTELHLEHTQVHDADLANVSGLIRLSYINLYDTLITDAGLEHLKTLTNLQHLHLWQTKVTDEGVAALRKVLPDCDVDEGWVSTTVDAKPAEAKK
jgi:hypothetical protein